MMNSKIIKAIAGSLLFATVGTMSYARISGIIINDETFSLKNKNDNISLNFDSDYDITNESAESSALRQSMEELVKKTTYLLLGEPNNKYESSENYYKRHQDYLKLRYNPEIPKDESSFTGLDENSQEYNDDIVSGISVPGMFLKLNELEVKYNCYGETRIVILDNNNVLGTIQLENVEMKEPNTEDLSEYNTIRTNLTLYYYFKKLNNDYKLFYLYGETNDEIKEYINGSNEKIGILSKDKDYQTDLRDIYDFSKADEIEDGKLTKIFDNNKSNIVFLNSTYNIGTVTSANGFFINNQLIVTTYNYIEKSLMKAQNIIINDILGNVYELDGIVTMNRQSDIAVLKVKNKSKSYMKIENADKIKKEDAIISLNSKLGVGLTTSKGIIIGDDQNIEISLPITEEMQGSPIFDVDGKLIGMINSENVDMSTASVTRSNIIKKYYDKFKTMEVSNIKCVTFEDLKNSYYIKYNEEKVINNISKDKFEEYDKVENVDDYIKLNLIKGSYKDGIITLRYKNDVSNYINTMQLATEYIENLKNRGYQEYNVSNVKSIYKNEKYQIVIMSEFDYLIIVMVKL